MTPRVREFNEEEALERAMQLFWEKGYEATSLQDLIDAMGISKSSFYETFGSKHDLFIDTIACYIKTIAQGGSAVLDREPSGRKAIERYFMETAENLAKPNNATKGCLLCNCAVELARHDPAAAPLIARGFRKLENAFHRAIVRGQEVGEIRKNLDPRVLAKFFLTSSNGMLVMAKGGMGRAELKKVVHVILSAMD